MIIRNLILVFSLLVSSIFISSCVKPVRTTTYFDEVSEEYIDISMPIDLEPKDYAGPKTHAYLLLERNRSNGDFFVKIRWNLESKYRPNIASQDSMKIMIDGNLVSYSPTSPPEILSINIEPRSIEEEAVYQISIDLLESLLKTENATIFISGQKLSLKANLASKQLKSAIANFLEHITDPR